MLNSEERNEEEKMDLRVRSKVEKMLADMKKNSTDTILHSHPGCKYRLPCGRCDKTGEMCSEFHSVTINSGVINLDPIVVPDPNGMGWINGGETENVKYSDATNYTTDASCTNHT